MDYQELKIEINPGEQRDILMGRLAGEGYESFLEEQDFLLAYIPASIFQKKKIQSLLREFKVTGHDTLIPEHNWNEEWEKNYDPVMIANRCYIRAPFHPAFRETEYEIIIEPRMSFGTAHHETTAMMIEMILESEMKGKQVLDMGCGTGILAILAGKMGAAGITAVDNDEWAVENAAENARKNNLERIRIIHGDVKAIDGRAYDMILANINRNVLLEQLEDYSRLMNKGELLLSGFYDNDTPVILEKAEWCGFTRSDLKKNKDWIAMKLIK